MKRPITLLSVLLLLVRVGHGETGDAVKVGFHEPSIVHRDGGLITVAFHVSQAAVLGPPTLARVPVGCRIERVGMYGKSQRVKQGGKTIRLWQPGTVIVDVRVKMSANTLSGSVGALSMPFSVVTTVGTLETHVLAIPFTYEDSPAPRVIDKPQPKDFLLIPIRLIEGFGQIFLSCPLQNRCSS